MQKFKDFLETLDREFPEDCLERGSISKAVGILNTETGRINTFYNPCMSPEIVKRIETYLRNLH